MFEPSANILIVDDAVTLRAMLKEFLNSMGYQNLFEARNVPEAIDTLSRMERAGTPVALVLCDMNMPGASGLDFLKSVRANPKSKNLPFLMITTEGQMRTVTEAVMAGVSGYLLKPVTVPSLAEKLAEVYKRHQTPPPAKP